MGKFRHKALKKQLYRLMKSLWVPEGKSPESSRK
jgi:hypothetical protein